MKMKIKNLLLLSVVLSCFNYTSGQNRLEIEPIVRKGINQLVEHLQRHNPDCTDFGKLIIIDGVFPPSFPFEDEKMYCGLLRESYIVEQMNPDEIKATLDNAYGDIRYLMTLKGPELCIHISSSTYKGNGRASFGPRIRIVYRYSCEKKDWEYITTDFWEF